MFLSQTEKVAKLRAILGFAFVSSLKNGLYEDLTLLCSVGFFFLWVGLCDLIKQREMKLP